MIMALPYLSEHEAPTASDKDQVDAYNPTPEEKKLAQAVEKMYQRAKSARSNYDYRWIERYKMFRGQQWLQNRPSYRSAEVFNLVFQTIQSQVPILTDARPKIEFMPQEPNDRAFAEVMNKITESDWERGNFNYELAKMIYGNEIYGSALSYLGFDREADFGQGRICFKPEEIHFMFPDPDGCDEGDGVQDCDFFIRAQPLSVKKVRKMYPKVARFIKGDTESILNVNKNELMPIRMQLPANDRLMTDLTGGSNWPSKESKVTLLTCYYRDIESVDEEKAQDGTDTVNRRLRFPKGRKVVVANGVVCEDTENEYDDGKWPWQKMVNYIAPHEFWGISELEPIEGPQRIFNRLVSFVLDVLHLTGNPIWIVDSNSGIDTDNLTSAPGLIVEKNPGSEVRRETGVQLQPYVLSLINQVKEWIDQISGAQDITRGITPGGVTAASAIESLQNAAQTRLRQKSRNIDAFLQEFGQQYASRVMQFYTAPMIYRLTGDDGAKQYFKAWFGQDEEGNRTVKVQYFDQHPQTGDLLPRSGIDTYQLRGKLDVSVTTGSSLPFSKAQNRDQQLALFDRGAIDREELLKSLEYPNYQAVLERMAQAAQQAANAQAGKPAA
jgi:hypothetical protein